MVYVLNKDGQPLMPTTRHGRVRHLLKEGKAAVVRRCPFTIRLSYDTRGRTQPVDLGVDAGSKHVGLSACTAKAELFAAELHLRTDISKKLAQRRMLRRARRSRKTRYRKARFQNRVHARNKGWLAPSVQAGCGAHVTAVRKVMSILPVTGVTVEMAPFDTQKLKAQMEGTPLPSGGAYQHGESDGYDNMKAYVKWRDGYKCRVCGKEHVRLQGHHRQQRKDGGSNRPANLVTVCEDCHKAYHAGQLTGKKAALMAPGPEAKPLRDAAFMSVMRWAVWERLKAFGLPLHMSFGYITARQREQHGVDKSHHGDARCISGHGGVPPASEWFYIRKVRCHNRQIHKLKVMHGGIRKKNQAAYTVRGYRLFDKVRFAGQECFIFGRRTAGSFDLRTLDGTVVSRSTGYRHLTLVEMPKHMLTERRPA